MSRLFEAGVLLALGDMAGREQRDREFALKMERDRRAWEDSREAREASWRREDIERAEREEKGMKSLFYAECPEALEVHREIDRLNELVWRTPGAGGSEKEGALAKAHSLEWEEKALRRKWESDWLRRVGVEAARRAAAIEPIPKTPVYSALSRITRVVRCGLWGVFSGLAVAAIGSLFSDGHHENLAMQMGLAAFAFGGLTLFCAASCDDAKPEGQ